MGTIRRRGRQADPKNVRLVLHLKYGDTSFTSFADRIARKMRTTLPGGENAVLPEYSTVLRFCRGHGTDEVTWGPLCAELGIPFSLLEKGHTLSKSELGDAEFKRHWSFCHLASYSGQVWIQVVAKFENRAEPHHYTIRWGPWKYSSDLTFGGLESATLIHMKGDDGLSVPIIVDVSLPCYIAFGRGDPPGELIHDINHGWTYVDAAASEQPPIFQRFNPQPAGEGKRTSSRSSFGGPASGGATTK